MTKHVHLCSDAESLAQHACKWLTDKIQSTHARTTRNFTLALSGGSTPKRLYELLAELPSGTIDWTRVVLVWGDERNVASDDSQSNFRMVREALLDRVAIPSANVLAVPNPAGVANSAATAYEQLLRDYFAAFSDQRLSGDERSHTPRNAFPAIDCVLLGMGDDVHTASLFPGTEALAEKSRWVVGNYVPKLNCWRITLTAPLINAAENVVFLIAGASKTPALSKLWHGPIDPNRYPSQLIQPHHPLYFLLDKAALADLPLPEDAMVQIL